MEQAAANNSKQQIGRACNLCRLSHTACESTRPCRRCIAIGKAHLCADVEMRKRGRPRKSNSNNGNSNEKSSGRHRTKSASTSARAPSMPEAEDASSNDADAGMARKTTRPATNEWQSAATAPSKRPRIEPAEGFKIRMPSLAFDPFDPFQVSAATAASSSMVSVSRTAASNLQHHSHSHSHSERISNISSSFFGLAESSLSASVPHEAAFSSSSASSFSYSLHGASSASSSSSSSFSATAATAMSLDMSSSSSSSSSPPSSPYSSSSSSPLSSFDSNQSLLGSLSSTLLRPGAANSNSAERKREDVLEGILSLVLEELREVKQHNRDMRKQLNKVVKRQEKTEQQLLQVASSSSSPSPSSLSSSSSSAASSGPSSSSTAAEPALTAAALAEILNRMPFLLDYSVSPSTFVIKDARKPFYALRVISQYIGEDSSPPIFIFVNNSFAELSGYALNELLGRNVNKVTCVDEQAKKEMLSKLFQSAPQTISEPFALQVMMRRKDGRVLQCACRHQAFYNELGYIRWCVTVVDSYTELNIRGEDLSLDWTPPIAWANAPSNANRPPTTNTPTCYTSSSASSSPSASSSCATPGTGSENSNFVSPPPPQSLPAPASANSYPSFAQQHHHHHQQQVPSFESRQSQNQQQHHNSMPPYPHSSSLSSSSSAAASAPSPQFSGAVDDRIDLQELLLQLIPPSPSLPSFSVPSTPSGGTVSLTSSSSSLAILASMTSNTNPPPLNHHQQPPGSGGSEYSWLKELQQTPPAPSPSHFQQQTGNGWFDTDT